MTAGEAGAVPDDVWNATCRGCGGLLHLDAEGGWLDTGASTLCGSDEIHSPYGIEDAGSEYGLTRHHVEAARAIVQLRVSAARDDEVRYISLRIHSSASSALSAIAALYAKGDE